LRPRVVRPLVRPSARQILYAAQAVGRRLGCPHTAFQLEEAAAFNCEQVGSWCDGHGGIKPGA
jgi:hypothetical protein